MVKDFEVDKYIQFCSFFYKFLWFLGVIYKYLDEYVCSCQCFFFVEILFF